MEYLPDRQGLEFDWFAMDNAGHVAVFATAGSGPIPVTVRARMQDHDALGARICVTGWGTRTVWDSYARAGLFAYDWDDRQCCYTRVARPTHRLIVELSGALAAAALPRLPLSFDGSPCIGNVDDAHL